MLFRVTTWGESHGAAIGAVIDGCPPNIELSGEDIQGELDRRRPGRVALTSSRGEVDRVEILSGVFEGRTTGTPISLLVGNRDVDSASYEGLRDVFRPGHGDFTYFKKYGIRDHRAEGEPRDGRRRLAWRRGCCPEGHRREGIEVLGFTVAIGGVTIKEFSGGEVGKNSSCARCPGGGGNGEKAR